MFKHKFIKKTISLALAIVMMASAIVVFGAVGGGGSEAFLKEFISLHRNFATDEQNTALAAVENSYNAIKQKGHDEAPWVNVVVNGEGGITPLLTDQIKSNTKLARYIELNFLENKTISIKGITNTDLSNRLAAFVSENNSLDSQYDLGNMSIGEASGKFEELSQKLAQLYREFKSIKSSVESLGGTIEIKDGNTVVTMLSEAQIHTEMQIMLTNFLKDLNGLVFSSKATYEEMYDNLLSSDNKKFIGALFGAEFADALKSSETSGVISNYLKSSSALSKIAAYQMDILNGTKSDANNAIYLAFTNLINELFAKSEMAAIKSSIENIGWTVGNLVAANKFIGDTADPNYNSRIININIFIGRHMKMFKNNVLCPEPIEVDAKAVKDDVYDIRMYLEEPAFSAKIINLVSTKILNTDGSVNPDISTKNDSGKLEFIIDNVINDDFKLYTYRSGGSQDVYGYLRVFDVEVSDDTVHAGSIIVTEGSIINLRVGAFITINARISPSNATDKVILYSSANPSIATVNAEGKITGVSEGTTIITVASRDGFASTQITVNVTKPSSPSPGGGAVSGTGTINVGSGGSVSADGITVTANQNSFQTRVQMQVNRVAAPSMPSGAQIIGNAYTISYTPNVPLLSPLSLTLKMDLESYDPSMSYSIHRYDEATGNWVPYTSTISNDKTTITATVDAAGIFAILASETTTFADLAGHWSEESIMTLYRKGIVTGYSPTEFAPDREITRAEFAVIVYRMLGLSNIDGFVYSDTENHWARDYISSATAHGFMIGYDDDTFRPDISVSREQILTVLIRAKYLNLDGGSGTKYTNDELIAKLVEQNPQFNLGGVTLPYTDAHEVSAWAEAYVKAAVVANAVQGYEDGTVRPLNFGTRAEAMVLAMRIIGIN